MNERRKAVVILNPFSHGETGRKRWEKVKPFVETRFELEIIETTGDWKERLGQAIDQGVRVILAAGGDGTVHDALNALGSRASPRLSEFTLGGIGLGSSNDFHKPILNPVLGIPVKIDADQSRLRDVMEVTIENGEGPKLKKLFIVSSSIGFVAEANDYFNKAHGLMKFLKKQSTALAIPFAAVKTIFTYRNVPVRMKHGADTWDSNLSSFHVMKTLYLSGSFRFDTEIEPNNRKFSVNLMEDFSLREIIQSTIDLSSGKFLKGYVGKKRRHWETDVWEVQSDKPLPLELDGELYEFTKASFRIFPDAIRECV